MNLPEPSSNWRLASDAVPKAEDNSQGFRLLYHDNAILVVDKASGLLSVPGRGPALQDCLWRRLLTYYPAALVVHRLDRDTSGVMVFALNSRVHRHLSAQFEARRVLKNYVALLHGSVAAGEGIVSMPLAKDFEHPPRHRVDYKFGREAITYWRVTCQGDDRSRVSLQPATGRSHQLRIHMAELGYPILGDPLYAPPAVQAAAPRLMLHATRLTFEHPETGFQQTFEAPCPF